LSAPVFLRKKPCVGGHGSIGLLSVLGCLKHAAEKGLKEEQRLNRNQTEINAASDRFTA
jgi:hypothetical protein